ncbi:proton-coupled folate transporter isoform X2 [Nilaparvata lugens]|uniref:proton-coupled folate transporter isoform X2 n=1 Tax=Nilaparvata lugens TaxID=108931 RepID=UPI00193E6227|nr:proton-coupled folate transporter isoform X2 [Nilaparvata lugens]
MMCDTKPIGGAREPQNGGQNPQNGSRKPSKEPTSWSEMTSGQKMNYLVNNITVEPMLACYIIPSVLASLATQNLNLEKACRVNLRYGDEVCTALEARQTANYTREEIHVQELVAHMSIWKTFLQSSLPAVLIMFLGSWSDRRRKRKPCMLMPIIGELFTSIGLIVCTYYFYELPMEVAGVVEGLFPAITGGWMTMFMAIFSYIGDVTTLETRTLRIGVVNVFCSIGIPIGSALSGVLYKKIGFYGVFSLAALLYMFSFIYGALRIKENHGPDYMSDRVTQQPSTNNKVRFQMPEKLWTGDEKKVAVDKDKDKGFLRDFFDLQHIRDTLQVAFKDGANNRKKRVILLMVVVMVVMGPMHGEMTVMYLFTRYRFNWNEVDYSVFSTYSMVTNLIGTLFSVGVFSHMLKIDDALIGVMSCMSKIMAGFVYAFATTTWMIYLAPIVDIVNGTSFIAMRSIASKLVPPEELGKVNSLFGVCEALMPLVYGPMYSAVYASTMHTMPGAFFLLGGALTTPAVVIFAWMYTEHKKDEVLERIAKEKECRKENGDLKNDSVKIQVVSTPQMQPEVQPQRQPEVQPQIQPQRQPEVQPQRQPEVQPQRQPEVQPPGQPQVQPQRQPELHPQGQPNDAGFVNQGFEADETSRST